MAKPKQPTDPRPSAAAQSGTPPPGEQPGSRPASGAAQKRARQRAGRQAAAAGGQRTPPPPPPARPAPARPAPASGPSRTTGTSRAAGAPRTTGPAEPAARPGGLPATVRYAVWCMYAGAALSALALIVTIVTAGEARRLLHEAEPQLSAAKVSAAVHTGIISSAAIWVITIALWVIMAKVNQAGRGWARIAGTVLCVASTLSLAGYITQAYPVALKVTVVPLWLAGLAATALLWRPATTSYIRSGRS
ncbi:MAG TPA: hypothetical protein VFV41_08785 [Streptosporangiaceae bacterium]|nr:hypothetical protein [Streptosporangiaceae bacterium]